MTSRHSDRTEPKAGLGDLASGTPERADEAQTDSQSAAYVEWLAEEIRFAIDDPRPSIPHEEVMALAMAQIARRTQKQV